MTLGMLHGRVVAEFDSTPVADASWNAAMLSSFSGFFVGTDELPIWKQLAQ
jgi:hypothetical protein